MIPDHFKQDLLNRVDIVDVVSRYVKLKKAGANFQGLCPFHNEKSPSFSVSPAKQFYHCFGCSAHGNAIGFLMAYASMGYVDAIKELAAGCGMTVPEETRSAQALQRYERETDLSAVLERAMDFYREQLKHAPQAIAYLKARGLTGEIAARFRIGYAPDDWQPLKAVFPEYEQASLVEAGLVVENEGKRYDRFRGRVMFPIFNQRGAPIGFGGRVIGAGEPKYLNSPETVLFEKGRELYGLSQANSAIRQANRVLVVEGYMDVVALAQHGVSYAVATLGTATTAVHIQKLLRLSDEIVFAFDGDNAGRKAAWRALETSLPLSVDHKPMRFLFLPQGHDPDSYVREFGTEAFEREVRAAQPLSTFLVSELRAQSNPDTAEGRSRLLVLAKPHLKNVAAPALRLQLLKAVAELARVSQEEAEELLEIRPVATTASRYVRAAPPRVAAPGVTSPEMSLLRCVLAQPALVERLEDELMDSTLPETEALLALRQRVADKGIESWSVLYDVFQGTAHEAVLVRAQMASDELGLLATDAAQQFEQSLLSLRIRAIHAEIERLKREVVGRPELGVELARCTRELAQLKGQRI